MLDDQDIDAIRAARQAWEPMLGSARVSRGDGAPAQADPALDAQPLYTPADLADHGVDYLRDLGFPGQYPFTRGIHPSMYRGRFFTMRQYAGFGSAEETNRRFRHMLGARDGGHQHRLRPAHPAWLRLRRPSRAGRGRQGRGARQFPSRPRDALRRHPARSRRARPTSINAPAAVILAMHVALGRAPGRAAGAPRGVARRTTS